MINRIDQDEEAVERPFDRTMFVRLLSYISPYRRLAMVGLGALLLGTASQIAGPYMIKIAIDQDILPKHYAGLWVLGGLLVIIAIVRYIAYRSQTYIISRLGQEVLRDLRSQLFHHLQALHLGFYDRVPSGKIITRVTSDVSNLNQLLSAGLVNTVGNMITLFGTMIAMFVLKPSLALVSFIVIPLLIGLSTGLRRRIVERWRVVRRRTSVINATWAEDINGIRVMTAFGRQPIDQNHFERLSQSSRQVWIQAMRLSALFGPSVDLAGTVGTGLVFWYGAHLYMSHQIRLGLVVAFVAYMASFWDPISQLGQFYNQLLVAMASAERVFEYLDHPTSIDESPQPVALSQMKGAVTFDHVSFGYGGDGLALRDVSFNVVPGQTVALVGPTGSGKSSILNLIPRFYDVTDGRILIDGYDVRDLALQDLRMRIALVLQDTFIFDATIRDNIRFSRPTASDQEVEAAARAVGAHQFIAHLPQAYDTPVRERGSRLSQGQRQLLAFARAILADPAILILDEATASIDTQTEAIIQTGLKRLLEGRTAFVAAHRLSTIRQADVILVIRQGRIVEMGTHVELLARGGVYYRLVMAQMHQEATNGWVRRNPTALQNNSPQTR